MEQGSLGCEREWSGALEVKGRLGVWLMLLSRGFCRDQGSLRCQDHLELALSPWKSR